MNGLKHHNITEMSGVGIKRISSFLNVKNVSSGTKKNIKVVYPKYPYYRHQ